MDASIRVRSAVGIAATVVVTAIVTAATMQAWSVGAAPGDEESTFVPIEPCRLFDFRPGEPPSGGKKSPLQAGSSNAVTQQVTGSVGDCDVPATAVGVSMNVTIANPTASSFLRVYPADAANPPVSSLNWVAGQAPTPNKVDVKLSADGKIALFNNSGTVDVLADVVGYYKSADLDGITSRLGVLEAARAGEVIGETAQLDDLVEAEVVSIEVDAPVAGTVVVNASGAASDMFAGGKVFCSITTGSTLAASTQAWESAGSDGSIGQLAGSRAFPVGAGTHTFNWICQSATSDNGQPAVVSSPTMTYVFVPG